MAASSSSSAGICPDRLSRSDARIRRFIAEGKLAGAVTLVSRQNEIVHCRALGWLDLAAQVPMREDALFRIYSMTKLVTSVAVMILYERGSLDLNDPVHRYLPGFRNLPVIQPDGTTEPSVRDITIYDLLRHCAGLAPGPDADAIRTGAYDLESLAREWSTKPLIAQPGERWIYGLSTDLLARVVEVISGVSFDRFLQDEIFDPLDMKDTAYSVDASQAARLCVCYRQEAEGGLTVQDGNGPESSYRCPPRLTGGGSGLVSTARDYHRFAAMLLGKGAWKDRRILGRKTVELMTLDHLPAGHPNLAIGTQSFRFGLGFSVVTDVAQTRCLSSQGDFGWGGAAGTQVWINPEEQLVVLIMIQVRAEVPTGIMDIYKRLVYQALV